jgi:hypothetical protein
VTARVVAAVVAAGLLAGFFKPKLKRGEREKRPIKTRSYNLRDKLVQQNQQIGKTTIWK